MEPLRGRLVVTMKFEIPVSEEMYPRIKQTRGYVLKEDIVAAEEQNYLANVDNYLDLVGDYITEVEFAFDD
jgi:hypothetical protein